MKSNGKVRPLGSKGSNPLQGHKGPFVYPCFFRLVAGGAVVRALHRHRPHLVFKTTNNVLRLLVVAAPPRRCRPNFVVLRPLSFLGRNRIFCQRQNDRAAQNTEDHQAVNHQ